MTEKQTATPPLTMSSKHGHYLIQACGPSISRFSRAIAGVLNSDYQKPSYGLGNASTVYPISAFITHLVWLEGTLIEVDAMTLTVGPDSIIRHRCLRLFILQALGVKSIMVRSNVEGNADQGLRYDADMVRRVLAQILAK